MWGDPERKDATKVHRPQLHTGTGARYTRLGSLKMPFSFTNNLFCCTTPNHVALVGEKKTSEARGERGEEQRIIEAGSLIIDR